MRNLHYKLLCIALLFVVTGCDKSKDELRSELRLLRAGNETGVNTSEFSQRVIHVRAAHHAAEKRLSQREKTAYARLDSEVTACLFFWKEYTSGTFKRYSYEAEQVVQMFGLRPQRGIKSEEVYYYPQNVLRQMLTRSSQSIDAFLDGTTTSADSEGSRLRAVEEAVVGEIRKKAVRGDAAA